MNKLHYVKKSINVLNCLLMLAVAAGACVIIVPFLNRTIQPTLPAAGIAETEPTSQPASLPHPSQADYAIVGEQNLFHPERMIPPENKVETAVVIPKPELVLYGTLISDNLSIAYIEDKKAPYSTPGRGKRQTQLKKGDNVSGYVLQEIEPNHIVLVKGEEKLVVMLDEKDRKRGGETATPVAATSSPGGLPPSSAVPTVSRPATSPAAAASQATTTAPAVSPTPASTQGAKPTVQSGPPVTRPGQPPDPRRMRMQNK
ncbi:MAG: hypothetical protein Q8K00_10020 [Syntrophales bacterium]|nr:hypothetical protein [Syntrophales bacterium]